MGVTRHCFHGVGGVRRAPGSVSSPHGGQEPSRRIRVYAGGALLATPLLDISSKTTTDGERGRLSVAFHPDFASNGYFFVDYTNTAGNIVVERYRITGDPHTSNVADPTSAATLLVIPHPTNSNHTGGQLQIAFGEGANGELYATVGNDVVQLVSTTTVPIANSAAWRSALTSVLALVGVLVARRRSPSAR